MTQTRNRRYALAGGVAMAIILVVIMAIGGGTQPVCPTGPHPTYDLVALSSLSDLTTAQQLAPAAAQEVASQAATQCAEVQTGIVTGGSVANLQISSPQVAAPTGRVAKRGPVIAQYRRQVFAAIHPFIVRLDHAAATSGSPVFGAVRRAIENYANVSSKSAGPLVIVLLTDGLSVERTDSGKEINLEAPSVSAPAVRYMASELTTATKQAHVKVLVFIDGFGANAPFGDERLDRDIAIESQVFKQAGIDFRWNRSGVAPDLVGAT